MALMRGLFYIYNTWLFVVTGLVNWKFYSHLQAAQKVKEAKTPRQKRGVGKSPLVSHSNSSSPVPPVQAGPSSTPDAVAVPNEVRDFTYFMYSGIIW